MTEETVSTTLPQWVSHKTVRAAEITGIGYSGVHGAGDIEHVTLTWKIEGRQYTLQIMGPDPKIFTRYKPLLGDYWVQYPDGYLSISPRTAFEDGYSRI